MFPFLKGIKVGKEAYKEYTSALAHFNRNLKRLARACGVSIPITSYSIRHSFAMILKEQDVPIEMISELLGHKSIKTTLQSFDPEYPFNVRFFDEVLNGLYEKERSLSSLITLFSLIAIFISVVGVFGLVVFDSEYRKKEIGIRKVLGSTTEEIIVMFNKTYIRILCVCFVLGAPIAGYVVLRMLENFAYKTPMYWWVYLIAFAIIAVITILTVTFQNWRAANENPVHSIKNE